MPELEKSQYYQQVSRANLTVLAESVWHLMTSAIFGANVSDCFMKLGQNGSWEKMYQGCYQVKMDGFSDEFSGTWMKWGVMYSGCVFQPMQSEPSFGVSVSQLWPRPIASDSLAWKTNCKANPRISIAKGWGGGKQDRSIYNFLWHGLSATQTADYQEMMMGFPEHWTDLKQSETP